MYYIFWLLWTYHIRDLFCFYKIKVFIIWNPEIQIHVIFNIYRAFFRTKRCELTEMHRERRKMCIENWTILIRSSWGFPLCLEGGYVNLWVMIWGFWGHPAYATHQSAWRSCTSISQVSMLICQMKNFKTYEWQYIDLLLIKPLLNLIIFPRLPWWHSG